MKVLLIGSGGREHAMAWKLAESSRVTELFVAPGNAGTSQVAENVAIDPLKFKEVEKFIKKAGVQFVVIGPEDPLAAGLADFVRSLGVAGFGPTKEAARSEEGRVGKEGRSRWVPDHLKKKKTRWLASSASSIISLANSFKTPLYTSFNSLRVPALILGPATFSRNGTV